MIHKYTTVILCNVYTTVRKRNPGQCGRGGGDQAIRKTQEEISDSHAEILERWTV